MNAYRSLANDGVSGVLTLRPRPAPAPAKAVIQEGAAFIVSDILADRAARSVTFALTARSAPLPIAQGPRRAAPYPGRDMSIALDPDIPAERQRLYLRAEPALPGLAWQIDRVPVTSPAGHIVSGLAAGAGPASSHAPRIRTAG